MNINKSNQNPDDNIFNNYDDYTPDTNKNNHIYSAPTVTTIYNANEGKNLSQRKCPTCGATDILFNHKTYRLVCRFCKNEFNDKQTGDLSQGHDISKLRGRIVSLGAANTETCDSLVTLKCSSCGAEVTLDQKHSHQTKCHWCRSTLSINNQIPNGAIPDIIIPFSMTRDEAYRMMKKFISERKFYAKHGFKKAFKKSELTGVYFPYMVVDVNSHINYKGEGEKSVVRYEKGLNKATEVFNAKLYSIERDFDLYIDNLILEASKDKLYAYGTNTNNIINSILPYDISKAVPWDANYINEYSVEKRDATIDDVEPLLVSQIKDITRKEVRETITNYGRGVRWDKDTTTMIGDFWQSAYLPVWLFTYRDKKGSTETLHYIAINAQTREIMGSVPFNKYKLKVLHFLLLIMILPLFLTPIAMHTLFLLLLWGISCYATEENYRNSLARHMHEEETTYTVDNMQENDAFIKELRNLPSEQMEGCNHLDIKPREKFDWINY